MLDLNKLKTGDKVAFSEKIEKIVSHICRDNGETRSVGFRDGTILNKDDSLWELAESKRDGLPEGLIKWKLWPKSRFECYGYGKDGAHCYGIERCEHQRYSLVIQTKVIGFRSLVEAAEFANKVEADDDGN